MSTLYPWMVWKDDTNTERRRGRWDVYSVSVNGLKRRYEYRETKRKMRCLLCIREWSEKTIRIQRDEEEDEMSTLYPWMVWKDDTNTKGWSRHQNIHLIRPMSCVFYLRCFLFELFCLGCFVWVALSELSFVWVVLFLSCVLFELCLVWVVFCLKAKFNF